MGANAITTFPTYVAGEILGATRLNATNCGVPVFATTATRDAAFGGTGEKTLDQGQMCYIEAAPKRFQVYNGTAWLDYDAEWTSYTPTLTQGVAVTKTVNYAKYARVGKTVVLNVHMSATGAGTATSIVTVSLPVNSVGVSGTLGLACGAGYFYDASTTQWYVLAPTTGTTVVNFGADATGANSFGAVPAVTIANTDVITFFCMYEAA